MQPVDRIASLERVSAAPLHLALVEPEIPPNTGNIARLCAATGCALHLVEPLGFRIDDRELKRAGLDYWEKLDVVIHASLAEFLNATRGRRRWFLSAHAEQSYAAVRYARGDMLVFGKETKGLPKDLLADNRAQSLRIPIRPGTVRSLNLSTAVGVAAYAALEQLAFPGLT
ncbi:MAG: tRNA (cytidine(34)-2'-O)-methyltransferase [Candidatus Eremiobacteraeota bacterium]|nr:tRNA (cytidine(34)-2'-O)-methyltransferase [Candidatus Eremiobacteraeota bacterium]